jgi:3-isopropylmalate dehydratase small subunit
MEDIDPAFAGKVSAGDFIVAGANFGCGSSREHAPVSIKAAGISAVIAGSFARIFFRNSFNIGLPILESKEAAAAIAAGDELEIDLAGGTIKNLTQNAEYQAVPVPDFMRELIDAGGLMAYAKKRMSEIAPPAPEKAPAKPEAPKARGSRMKELESEQVSGKSAPWVDDQEQGKKATEDERMEADEAEEAEEETSGS